MNQSFSALSLRTFMKIGRESSRYNPTVGAGSTRRMGSVDMAQSHLSKLDQLSKLDLIIRHGRIQENIKEDVSSYE